MVSLLLFALAGALFGFMDRWMEDFQNLTDKEKTIINPNWFSFNPLAKWDRGIWGKRKADNIFFLRLGIKTAWLTDNCNDGWHFFKSIAVISLAIACMLYKQILPYGLDIIFFGLAWNVPFDLTHHRKK